MRFRSFWDQFFNFFIYFLHLLEQIKYDYDNLWKTCKTEIICTNCTTEKNRFRTVFRMTIRFWINCEAKDGRIDKFSGIIRNITGCVTSILNEGLKLWCRKLFMNQWLKFDNVISSWKNIISVIKNCMFRNILDKAFPHTIKMNIERLANWSTIRRNIFDGHKKSSTDSSASCIESWSLNCVQESTTSSERLSINFFHKSIMSLCSFSY